MNPQYMPQQMPYPGSGQGYPLPHGAPGPTPQGNMRVVGPRPPGPGYSGPPSYGDIPASAGPPGPLHASRDPHTSMSPRPQGPSAGSYTSQPVRMPAASIPGQVSNQRPPPASTPGHMTSQMGMGGSSLGAAPGGLRMPGQPMKPVPSSASSAMTYPQMGAPGMGIPPKSAMVPGGTPQMNGTMNGTISPAPSPAAAPQRTAGPHTDAGHPHAYMNGPVSIPGSAQMSRPGPPVSGPTTGMSVHAHSLASTSIGGGMPFQSWAPVATSMGRGMAPQLHTPGPGSMGGGMQNQTHPRPGSGSMEGGMSVQPRPPGPGSMGGGMPNQSHPPGPGSMSAGMPNQTHPPGPGSMGGGMSNQTHPSPGPNIMGGGMPNQSHPLPGPGVMGGSMSSQSHFPGPGIMGRGMPNQSNPPVPGIGGGGMPIQSHPPGSGAMGRGMPNRSQLSGPGSIGGGMHPPGPGKMGGGMPNQSLPYGSGAVDGMARHSARPIPPGGTGLPPGHHPPSEQQLPPGPPQSIVGSMSGMSSSHYPPLPSSQYQQPGRPQSQQFGYSQPPIQPMQPQQPCKLDPDQMPSPVQVMEDDRQNRGGTFSTAQKGQVPPLVTTKFVTRDEGNVGPRYIRSTVYSVPSTPDMIKQTSVPFGIVISPLAQPGENESLPMVVDTGEMGPVRCIRCKAYMCPFMQFIDGGRRFQCCFCKATTEVPPEYFQHLDHTGQRVDKYERPELWQGVYEYIATKEYCRNNTPPKPPAFIFVIDVSYNTMKCGMVHVLCQSMKEVLQGLPRDYYAPSSNMKVGFITYNSVVHFYNIKGSLAQPQMMIVSDVSDMFVPLLDGFLCDVSESAAVIDSLMLQIQTMFQNTRETETILGPAIQAGLAALQAYDGGGKLLVFHSSLPIAEVVGKLKMRDDRKVLGTDKERNVLGPQNSFYNNLGQECVAAGCSVDLFIFNNSYIDIATIGQVCRLTGGQVYKYTYFQADLDSTRFIEDLKRNISKPIAFDAIMRVRTSTGIRPTDFFGNCFMTNTTDMELASIDCDKAIAVEIKHDDKLTEEDGVYIQVALLFTSCGGQRRLRILNLSLNTCVQMADLYRNCELDTIINFFAKQAVFRLLDSSSPKQVKEGLINRCAMMLATYRKNCASPSSSGQLILPECMKLLPLYINCLIKSDPLSGGADLTVDDRSFVMQFTQMMDINSSVAYFYPRLIPLHDVETDSEEIPNAIRCSTERINDDGVYILENGLYMFLWIGINVNPEWVQSVFGVQSAAQIDIDKTTLLDLDTPLSIRVREIISKIRQERQRYLRLTLVRQRDKLDIWFKRFLVEDRGGDGNFSYVDFLCHMHKEIRNLLS